MTFFDAIDERSRLINEGIAAIAVESVDHTGKRTCLVFKTEAELDAYREFNRDWDMTINRLA